MIVADGMALKVPCWFDFVENDSCKAWDTIGDHPGWESKPDTKQFLYELTNDASNHYSDVIMGSMASQITSLSIVCSSVYSAADQRKHQSSASLAFVRRIHWMVSNAENVSIRWRHYEDLDSVSQRLISRKIFLS